MAGLPPGWHVAILKQLTSGLKFPCQPAEGDPPQGRQDILGHLDAAGPSKGPERLGRVQPAWAEGTEAGPASQASTLGHRKTARAQPGPLISPISDE